jgi:hypothetical protein
VGLQLFATKKQDGTTPSIREVAARIAARIEHGGSRMGNDVLAQYQREVAKIAGLEITEFPHWQPEKIDLPRWVVVGQLVQPIEEVAQGIDYDDVISAVNLQSKTGTDGVLVNYDFVLRRQI